MGILLHLKSGSSPSARKAVRTHSTFHHVWLWASSRSSMLLGNIQELQSLSPKSHETAGEERGSGPVCQPLSLLSMNSWFSSPPHPVRTCHNSKRGQSTHSVSVHVTGVGPLLLRLVIKPQEVFVAWGATHPGLPKPHCPGEEELALSRPHPALKGHLDMTSPPPYPHTPRYENLGLLSVEAADLHADRRVLLLLLHFFNTASCHWKHKAGRQDLDTGNGYISCYT